ncbi:MAG: efflux RND transporter periplasmic adaptor subunit [Planctomycetota bacterium]|jgi:RND family efflux transporter MFP subunit
MKRSETKQIQPVKKDGKANRIGRGLLQALFSIVIVILGIILAAVFIKLRKPPERMKQEVLAPLVKVEQLYVQDIPMIIRGHGTVSPKVEVDIVPEVPGKVVDIHPELKVGGLIPAKEQILRIDPRDYELAVRQADAAVADAQVNARREWRQLHPNTEPTSPLVLREPQIRKAQATLESAKAQLDIAKLKLERTSLSLPFDVLIISENVDLGQYVVVGQPLGKAYGIDAVEIDVPLEDDELAWFDVFNNSILVNGGRPSAKRTPAKVKTDFAGAEHTWKGYVVRTTGQVDETSRMISVVVEVPEPFDASNGKPPLLPGVFAEVLIEGNTLRNAVAVPRDAIRQGNKVWLINDDRLHIRSLEIARADKDFAYVVSGVADEVMIVLSSLDVVVEGMEVRTQADGPTEDRQITQDDNKPNKPEGN